MHSYGVLYDSGRATLRDSKSKHAKIAFSISGSKVNRPLRVVTYHARDVYPDLLRSTLLVRLVAAYEAFLLEAVQEVSTRSPKPFMNESRLDLTHAHLLKIDSEQGILNHIVQKTLRNLSGGGLKEIRTFYKGRLGTDLVQDEVQIETIKELHDRRHLFVHRGGYADSEYVSKHPSVGAAVDELLTVSESYLSNAISSLTSSSLFIKHQLEKMFPGIQARQYTAGDIVLGAEFDGFQYIAFRFRDQSNRDAFLSLSIEIRPGCPLKGIAAWSAIEGDEIRILVKGTNRDRRDLWKRLRSLVIAGEITTPFSFTIKR